MIFADSLLGFVICLIIIFSFRIKLNALTFFLFCSFCFNLYGLLQLYLIPERITAAFPLFKLDILSQANTLEAIVLLVFGLLCVIVSYFIAGILLSHKDKLLSPSIRLPNYFMRSPTIQVGINIGRLTVITSVLLCFLAAFILSHSEILATIKADILQHARLRSMVEIRRAVTSQYMTTLLIYNVLPFISIAWLLVALYKKTMWLRIVNIIVFTFTVVMLLFIVQKRPLLIYISAYMLCYLAAKSSQLNMHLFKLMFTNKVSLTLIALMVIAMFALFYYFTTYKIKDDGLWYVLTRISDMAYTRIIFRLALPSTMYVYYFPMVEPHYAYYNIGLLAKLLSFDFYNDSANVFNYFSLLKKNGHVAIPALLDFYGGFGYIGVCTGGLIIGCLLRVIDYIALIQKRTVASILFSIFALIFVYYLTQASLPRSLMGYGGIIFLLSYLILTVRPFINVCLNVKPASIKN